MTIKFVILLAVCVVLVIQLVSSTNALTNNDFCRKQSFECNGKYRFKCDNLCSADKRACTYFNSLVFGINFFKSRATQAQEVKKFVQFKISIKNCTIPKYEWNSADFCLNRVKCVSQRFDYGLLKLRTSKQVKSCPCSNKHSFKCNENLCSLDQIACVHFKNKLRSSKTVAAVIRSIQAKKIDECKRD